MVNALLCIAGTAGFCVVLRVSKPRFIAAVSGGTVSAVTAAFMEKTGAGIFIITLVAMTALCVFSEIAARLLKAPAAVIMIPGSVPLLPGGSMYYMMSFLIHFDSEKLLYYTAETLLTGAGIALGAVIVSIGVRFAASIKIRR